MICMCYNKPPCSSHFTDQFYGLFVEGKKLLICIYRVGVRSDSLLQTGLESLQALTFQLFWRRSTLILQRLLVLVPRLSSTCTLKPILHFTLCLRRLACAESLHKLPSLQASSGSGAMENSSHWSLVRWLSIQPCPSLVPAADHSLHPFRFTNGYVSPPGSF